MFFAVTLPSPYAIATRLLVSGAAQFCFHLSDSRHPARAIRRGAGSPLCPSVSVLVLSRRRGQCLAVGAGQALLLGFWGSASPGSSLPPPQHLVAQAWQRAPTSPPAGRVFQPLPGRRPRGGITGAPERTTPGHPPLAGSAVGDNHPPAAGVLGR